MVDLMVFGVLQELCFVDAVWWEVVVEQELFVDFVCKCFDPLIVLFGFQGECGENLCFFVGKDC